MKQQCNISFVYGSWLILLAGFIFWIIQANFAQAIIWVFFVGLFLWLYVRYFPKVSRLMGYGSVEDNPAENAEASKGIVTLYTGVGCPFCPLVRRRLKALRSTMGFELIETDVTLKPNLVVSKGIRALPVIEVGQAQWVGNATSQQLAGFIAASVRGEQLGRE